MSPLVSIIIPAYNAAPWIGAALGSALNQSHSRKEIIVVDDGSTDGTLAAAQLGLAPEMTVVSQANSGAAAARNHGLRLAQGDYIQYLDADDLLSPHKIERQLALLSSRPAGTLATCRWGRFESDPTTARFVDDDVFRDFVPVEWILLHAAKTRMMHPAAWLVPRAVAERAGPWNENLSLNDDGEYFARVTLASAGIAFAPEADAATYYRSGLTGSLSRRRTPAACLSLYRAAQLLESHLLAAEESDRVRAALADHWQYLGYELYPDAPALSRAAFRQAGTFGRSTVLPPLGARAQVLAQFIGWRLARRLSRSLLPRQ